MGIESFGFVLDAEVLEFAPVVVGGDGAELQHRLGTGHLPAHAGTLHAVFDHVPARPFDDSRGDGVAGRQVLVVLHPVQIVLRESSQPVADACDGGREDGVWSPSAEARRGRFRPRLADATATAPGRTGSASCEPSWWNRWAACHSRGEDVHQVQDVHGVRVFGKVDGRSVSSECWPSVSWSSFCSGRRHDADVARPFSETPPAGRGSSLPSPRT